MASAMRPNGSKTSSKARSCAALWARRALGSTPRSSTKCPLVHTVAAKAWTITSSGVTVKVLVDLCVVSISVGVHLSRCVRLYWHSSRD